MHYDWQWLVGRHSLFVPSSPIARADNGLRAAGKALVCVPSSTTHSHYLA